MVNTIANAAFEGRAMLSTIQAEEEEAAGVEGEEALERYLGPSTLAKIRAEAVADDEEEEGYEDEGDYQDEEAADVEEEEEAPVEIEEAPPAPLIPSPIAAALAATASEEAEEKGADEE
jgi:hypothetical protein